MPESTAIRLPGAADEVLADEGLRASLLCVDDRVASVRSFFGLMDLLASTAVPGCEPSSRPP